MFLRVALLREAFLSNDGRLPETLYLHGLSLLRLADEGYLDTIGAYKTSRSVRSCNFLRFCAPVIGLPDDKYPEQNPTLVVGRGTSGSRD